MSDLLQLAEKSAETDLAFLIKAKEEAKKRMNANPNQENISAFNKARDAVDSETTRLTVPSGRTYKTQLDAVAYLKDAGYKVSKSQFNRDVKARRMPTTQEGNFEESALLGYAGAYLTPAAQVENKSLSEATSSRLSADAELKIYQAQRQKLKLEKEQGLLMRCSDHERDLGARALFFKNEVKNFIHLHGGAMVHLVGGDETKLPELVSFWLEATSVWMDAWSKEREFSVNDEAESEEATEE